MEESKSIQEPQTREVTPAAAEAPAEAPATAETPAALPAPAPAPAPDSEAEFDRLIHGPYREQFARAAGALLRRQARAQSQYYAYRRLQDQAADLARTVPGFTLPTAMADPNFAALIRAGADVAVAHRAAFPQAAETRPPENGLGPGGPCVHREDPSRWSETERAEIRRRALRGERVIL